MQFFKTYIHDFDIAIASILANKLRSFLTALGIIFGVAAVISMMSIGKGAEVEILEEIKMVGVNNILILPVKSENKNEDTDFSNSTDNEAEKQKNKYSPGLSMKDMEGIKLSLPSIKLISPEVIISNNLVRSGIKQKTKVLGISYDYFTIYNLKLQKGVYFNDLQAENAAAVCVIGANIRSKFFPQSDPIGQYIKLGNIWLQIIGVLENTNVKLTENQNADVNIINDNVFIPIKTLLLRFQNYGLINSALIKNAFVQNGNQQQILPNKNYHQLNKIIVQVHDTKYIKPTVEVLNRMLFRRHNQVTDYQISVPELILRQQHKTKKIFNIVLGAIASISLIVGGIGIMNIMFASVLERIKEIGVRLAIGAKKKDILVQFLSEAIMISVIGGILGIFLGIIVSKLITHFAEILTILSPLSVITAFSVSVSVGIIFGYYPAKGASEKNPIELLRYE